MGAEKVNDAVLCLMREFTAKHPEVYHIHATGSVGHDAVIEALKALKERLV